MRYLICFVVVLNLLVGLIGTLTGGSWWIIALCGLATDAMLIISILRWPGWLLVAAAVFALGWLAMHAIGHVPADAAAMVQLMRMVFIACGAGMIKSDRDWHAKAKTWTRSSGGVIAKKDVTSKAYRTIGSSGDIFDFTFTRGITLNFEDGHAEEVNDGHEHDELAVGMYVDVLVSGVGLKRVAVPPPPIEAPPEAEIVW